MANADIKVEKLHANNYTVWRIVMESTLKGKDLWDYVEATKLETDEDVVKNEQAKSAIYYAMDSAQIAATGICESAKDLWIKVQENHQGAASSQRSVALAEFLALKYRKNESLVSYSGRFGNLLGKLESTGHDVDDETKKWVLSNSLPNHMRQTVQMFSMSHPDGTVTELISQLKIQHLHISARDDQQASALYALGNRSHQARNNATGKPAMRQRSPNNKELRTCNYCKIPGHVWKDCRKLKADNAKKKQYGSNRQQGSSSQSYQAGRPAQPVRTQGTRPQFNSRFNSQSKPQTNHGYRAMLSTNNIPPRNQNSGAFIANSTLDVGDEMSWIVDSGASTHMTPRKDILVDYIEFSVPELITIGDGTKLEAIGMGDVPFRTQEFTGHLTNVYLVPGLMANLFSVGKAMELNCSIEFRQKDSMVYFYRDGQIVLTGHKNPESSYFQIHMMPTQRPVGLKDCAFVGATLREWHKRLGHCSIDTVKALAKTNAVNGMVITNQTRNECQSCIMGKMCRTHHPVRTSSKADATSCILHMDTVGPLKSESLGGSRYFVLSTDEYSGYLNFETFGSKDQIPDGIKRLISKAETESGRPVKTIMTDNGTEYKNSSLSFWLGKRGIVHKYATAYTPEQNGRAERANRTILNCVRTLLYESGMDEELWAEALNTAVYTTNRIPSRSNNSVTRYELFRGEKPNLSNLRVFGQQVIYRQSNRDGKLAPRGEKGVFVGYTERFNTYRIYRDEPTKQIIESCDVKFLSSLNKSEAEKSDSPSHYSVTIDVGDNIVDGNQQCEDEPEETLSIDEPQTPNSTYHSISDTSEGEASTSSEPNADNDLDATIRPDVDPLAPQTGRQTRSQLNLNNIHLQTLSRRAAKILDEPRHEPSQRAHMAMFTLDDEPRTVDDAKVRDDWPKWKSAMDEEIDALNKNETWELVNRPSNCRPVKNKWVFKIKLTPNGEIERYKARLVAKGFTQIENVDYKETYAPVAGMNIIRLFLAIANKNRMKLIQFDIKTAFLYGELEETIYMDFPTGYPNPDNKICKLKKSLYGLKQAPRNWNAKFNDFLIKFDLTRSINDKCFYFNQDKSLLLVIYVDDALIASRDERLMRELIKYLESNFELKSMEAKMFLGIEIDYNIEAQELTLSQPNYISKVLEKFNMSEANPTSTPEQVGAQQESDELLTPDHPFKELVGSLLYLVTCTRPDIAHAVSMASRTSAPTQAHWLALKRILRYLKGTKNLGIRFRWEEPNELLGYSDADYANDPATRKSNTGFCIFYGGGPIAWRCQRQPIITLSTTEAEYVAGCDLVKEMIPIRDHLIELGELKPDDPARVLIDNQSTIKIATNEGAQQRTKHIDIRHKWLTEQATNKKIEISHVKGDEQVADILTKPLHKTKFAYNRSKLLTGMITMLSLVALISQSEAQRELKEVDDLILVDSDYTVIKEDNRLVLKVIFRNPCDIYFGNLSNARATEKLITECYNLFSRKHLGPLEHCVMLPTKGPDLLYIPNHFDCATESTTSDIKCEVSRRHGTVDSARELSLRQESWTRYKDKIKQLQILSRKKRIIPFIIPATVWATIFTGVSLKSYNVGKTNAQNLESVVNITNQHTEIFRESTKFYEDLRDRNEIIADWITKFDSEHGDGKVNLKDKEAREKLVTLVQNYTRQFDRAEKLLLEINSAASVKRVPNSLTLMDQNDQSARAVNKSTLHDCLYGLENRDLALYLDFSLPIKDNQTEVLTVLPMDHYAISQNGSREEYCWEAYKGPRHVIHNKSSQCTTGLLETKVYDLSVRAQTCLQMKDDIHDPSRYMDNWQQEDCHSGIPPADESRVQVHMVNGMHKIYCWPNNITLDNEPTRPCPNASFILEGHANYTIGNIVHVGAVFDTLITRKVRSATESSRKKQLHDTVQDDFDVKCEFPPASTNVSLPQTTFEVQLSGPDEEDSPSQGKRVKRSPMPPTISSIAIQRATPSPSEITTTASGFVRIHFAQKLRELGGKMNASVHNIGQMAMALPKNGVNLTKVDFDSIVDIPITAVYNSFIWIERNVKAIGQAIGLMTGLFVFVMLSPIIHTLFAIVRIARYPISLWMRSIRSATARINDMTDIRVPNPLRKRTKKWNTGGKAV